MAPGSRTAPGTQTSWDTTRPARRGQPVLLVVGVAALVPTLVLGLLRAVPPADDAAALLASFVPAAVLFAPVAAACLGAGLVRARARHRGAWALLAALAAILLALHVAWQAPAFVREGRAVTGPTFALLSLNAYRGEADPDQLTAAAGRADVVVLLETTPDGLAALDARGWRTQFPFDVGATGSAVSNTVVFSRYPLGDSRREGGSFDQWTTTVDVPDVGAVRLMAVHPCNPYCGGNRWAAEHAALRDDVRRELGGPLVVAGDFNAVPDHGPMQQLRRLGLRSATDLLGAGWVPTYPAGRLLPPLLPIDHVLVDDALTATTFEPVRVAGTDHLGLLVSIGRAG